MLSAALAGIFEVEAGDTVVILLDDWYRRLSIDSEIVAYVQVQRCLFRCGQYLLKTGCATLAVGVEGNVQFAFGGEVSDSLE